MPVNNTIKISKQFVFTNQVDLILCNPPRAQIGLATLVDAASGRIVSEPDSGLPYRLRVLSCDAQGLHPGDFNIIRLKLIETYKKPLLTLKIRVFLVNESIQSLKGRYCGSAA